MITKPLLILAFNRPNHIRKLIDSLRPHAPKKILVGLDGPRKNNSSDREKIKQVLSELNKIDWTTDVEMRVREENLGLRLAVTDAVTWAIQKYDEVIVVEDDIEVGQEFLGFMSEMLDVFRHDERVGHISGYNFVPESHLRDSKSKIRFSQIPESYAWATWARAWKHYDANLDWARSQSSRDLVSVLGTYIAALVWKINFRDAAKENINTWAYRWTATLWSKGLLCVVPNRNISKYNGLDTGTHTLGRASFKQLSQDVLPSGMPKTHEVDNYADAWLLSNYFNCTFPGLVRRLIESGVLNLIKILKTLA